MKQLKELERRHEILQKKHKEEPIEREPESGVRCPIAVGYLPMSEPFSQKISKTWVIQPEFFSKGTKAFIKVLSPEYFFSQIHQY